MTFATKKLFMVFMQKSGYEKLDDNKVYKVDNNQGKIAVYSWNQTTKTVDQMVMSDQTFSQLNRVVRR